MCPTVITLEAHNDEVGEVRNINFTHSGFTHHTTGMTGNFEYCYLVIKKIFLFEWLSEIEFGSYFLILNGISLFFGILLAISHLDELIE